MTNHTVLKPKKVVRDLIATLPAVYFPLLLINLPFIIFMIVFISPFLLPFKTLQMVGIISEGLYYFTMSFYIHPRKLLNYYFLLYIIYFVSIHPYLQGVSILYTNDHFENGISQTSKYYKKAQKIFTRLFFGHFAVFFRIAVLTFMLSIVVIPIALLVALGGSQNMPFLLIIMAVLIITFYSSKLILVPDFIIV